ncbi:ferritin-like domain-containing protein [Agromyces sp. Soil535]|uniref:ferritin-like domain-containing protein n=1 Tax=Agromyces sp. Soil535 TaxID=1736390 RepID=UPI0006F5AE0B|nr:ferritin-like domain-containing protein [Agromyces sp. Soil535]KRE28883.1 hypothetical protein ASG80_20625 [Agromyces sp. Soil535]
MGFEAWRTYYERNTVRQRRIEASVDWDAPCTMPEAMRRAYARSFQRFELGEAGDGLRLLAKAADAGDPVYLAALTLLVQEEQRHSALFARGLSHLGAPRLRSHWSDATFTRLRRMLGLRTELALFLIAESTAIEYFHALATAGPDAVIRGIGRRILTDEVEHLRFQVDRLRAGFASTPSAARVFVGICWGVIAAGAATVLAVDHGAALRACGIRPADYWGRAMRHFRRAAIAALSQPDRGIEGPSVQLADEHAVS